MNSWSIGPRRPNSSHTREQNLLDGLPVPPPEGAVVTDADDAVAVTADAGLPDGRRALRVAEDVEAAQIGIRSADVPNVGLADLKATNNRSKEPLETNLGQGMKCHEC